MWALSRNSMRLNNVAGSTLCCIIQLGYTASLSCTKRLALMVRLLFWIALIAIAVWLWRRIKNPPVINQPRPDQPQAMVRCAHCDLHVPQGEALELEGQWYCSADHRIKGPRQLDQ
jgi:uncharacterized protein